MHYTIQGTIYINCFKDTVSFIIRPDNKYLSPDKKYAVFYPKQKLEKNSSITVKLNNVGNTELKVSSISKNFVQMLSKIALSQKQILLQINDEYEIVGFTFPPIL